MTTINQLSAINSVSAGDLLAVFSTANGDARKAAMSVLLAYMQDNLEFSAPKPLSQYATPSASGFTVAIPGGGDGSEDTHLILTPIGSYAEGTIQLPPVLTCVDKQLVIVNNTKFVTTLTIDGNGAAGVIGAPTTLALQDFFTLQFDLQTTNWYRIS